MVNSLYNKAFGYTARKVIAHMPHFIDRDVLNECQERFPVEWDRTSSHKVRHGEDMQFAFAYMYYLMSVEHPFNVSHEFSRLDTDHDGILSVHELRTLITRIYDLPTSYEHWQDFESILLNCSSLQEPLEPLGVGVGPDSVEVWVTEKLVAGCDPLLNLMRKAMKEKNKYKFELEDESEIAFEMIRNNASNVLEQLDTIRKEPKKFVCLNDNIDHREKSAAEVVTALQHFYHAFFPLRSQFELPAGYRNRFLHMSQLRAWHNQQLSALWWSRWLLVVVFVVVLVSLCSGKIKQLRRSWLQQRTRERATTSASRLAATTQSRQRAKFV
eukprot:m.194339 g.194339  ORF g.194339 m.194339 type:complete len:327 (-) comp25794_c0_seq7:31-1011(-)